MHPVNRHHPFEYIELTTSLLNVPEIDTEEALEEQLQKILIQHEKVVVECQAPNGSSFRINTYPSHYGDLHPRLNFGQFCRYRLSQELAARLWGDQQPELLREERDDKYKTALASRVYHIVNRPPNLCVLEIFSRVEGVIEQEQRERSDRCTTIIAIFFIITIAIGVFRKAFD